MVKLFNFKKLSEKNCNLKKKDIVFFSFQIQGLSRLPEKKFKNDFKIQAFSPRFSRD